MKRSTLRSLALVTLLVPALVVSAWAYGEGAKKDMPAKPAKAAMSTFLIESPHTPEQCLQALDATAAMGEKTLAQWHYGCAAGEHVGWAIVHAPDEQAALNMVPELVRGEAKVHKISQLTAAQIKELHAMKH